MNASIKGEKYAIAFRIHLSHSTTRKRESWRELVGTMQDGPSGFGEIRRVVAPSPSLTHTTGEATLYFNGAREGENVVSVKFI